jgi:hypothetical protein
MRPGRPLGQVIGRRLRPFPVARHHPRFASAELARHEVATAHESTFRPEGRSLANAGTRRRSRWRRPGLGSRLRSALPPAACERIDRRAIPFGIREPGRSGVGPWRCRWSRPPSWNAYAGQRSRSGRSSCASMPSPRPAPRREPLTTGNRRGPSVGRQILSSTFGQEASVTGASS